MPRVDAIGVSSAGTFVGNSPMVASLFIKVPRERRDEVKSIYDRAGKEIGDVPLVVANDGDVTALAGFMSTGKGDILGIAMGTSEAVGYVNDEGNVLGWINELAFAPVDLSPAAMQDEWSGDFGVGCKYFSQDAVIKLAPAAGIAVSYTHLDVYKRQARCSPSRPAAPACTRCRAPCPRRRTSPRATASRRARAIPTRSRSCAPCSSAWRAPTTTTASCLTASSNDLVSSPTCQEVR